MKSGFVTGSMKASRPDTTQSKLTSADSRASWKLGNGFWILENSTVGKDIRSKRYGCMGLVGVGITNAGNTH